VRGRGITKVGGRRRKGRNTKNGEGRRGKWGGLRRRERGIRGYRRRRREWGG